MGKWLTFTKERFKPLEYLPLIIFFVGVNYLYARNLSGSILSPLAILILGICGFFFFFRMRLFDEIKDYDIDLVINPKRPLARGLISVSEVKKVILGVIATELLLISNLGILPFLFYMAAILYSLLMYEEFFIGDWLRPKLTTYAISHTIVVSLLGFALMSCVLGFTITNFSWNVLLFLLSHWFIFNLFEFARKTFDVSEERENVASYSKIFTLKGAYLLSGSQVALSVMMMNLQRAVLNPTPFIVLGLLYGVALLAIAFKPLKASYFRLLSTLYMALHFIILFILLWRN